MEPHSRPDTPRQGAESDTEVIVLDPAWHAYVRRPAMIVSRALRVTGAQASVVLANDRLVRTLNARHRGKNKPTNILTYEHPAPELILALGVIRREAAAEHRPVAHRLAHLVVHGGLHLLGLDHDHPGDAREMEMEEARLLSRIGIPNPWKRA